MKNDKTFIITSKYWSKGGHERMYHKVKLEREAWGVSKTVTGIVQGTDFYTDLKTGVVHPTEMPSKCRGSMLDALYEALTATTTKTSEEVVEEVVVEKDEEYYEDCGDICAYMTKSEGWDEVAKLPKVEKESFTSLGDWEGSAPLAHVQEEVSEKDILEIASEIFGTETFYIACEGAKEGFVETDFKEMSKDYVESGLTKSELKEELYMLKLSVLKDSDTKIFKEVKKNLIELFVNIPENTKIEYYLEESSGGFNDKKHLIETIFSDFVSYFTSLEYKLQDHTTAYKDFLRDFLSNFSFYVDEFEMNMKNCWKNVA